MLFVKLTVLSAPTYNWKGNQMEESHLWLFLKNEGNPEYLRSFQYPNTFAIIEKKIQNKPYKFLLSNVHELLAFFGEDDSDPFVGLIYVYQIIYLCELFITPPPPAGLFGRSNNSFDLVKGADSNFSQRNILDRLEKATQSFNKIEFTDLDKDYLKSHYEHYTKLNRALNKYIVDLKKVHHIYKQTQLQGTTAAYRLWSFFDEDHAKFSKLAESLIKDLKSNGLEVYRFSKFLPKKVKSNLRSVLVLEDAEPPVDE